MRVKVFTLRFDPRIEGFDDEGLRAFMADKQVSSVREHFFSHADTPYWAVMVAYELTRNDGEPGAGASSQRSKERQPDYRSILGESHWPLFNALRDWRSEKAKAEGVPPYLVFTNAQLAEVVTRPATSLAALGEIRGIGTAKVQRYGAELLAALGSVANEPAGEQAETTADSEEEEDGSG